MIVNARMTTEPVTDEIGIANDGTRVTVSHPIPQHIECRLIIDDRTRLKKPRRDGTAGGPLMPDEERNPTRFNRIPSGTHHHVAHGPTTGEPVEDRRAKLLGCDLCKPVHHL